MTNTHTARAAQYGEPLPEAINPGEGEAVRYGMEQTQDAETGVEPMGVFKSILKDGYFRLEIAEFISMSILCAFLLCCLASCAEREAPPTIGEQLEGFWLGGAWNHESNRYHFHDGAMWTERWESGVLIDRQDYHYSIKGDRINILDIASFQRREYRVEFPTDSTVWLEALPLGIDINLVRIR